MSTKDPMAVDESAMMVLLTSTDGSVLQTEDSLGINQTDSLEEDPDLPLYKVRHFKTSIQPQTHCVVRKLYWTVIERQYYILLILCLRHHTTLQSKKVKELLFWASSKELQNYLTELFISLLSPENIF